MTDNKINIFYAVDDNFAKYTIVSIVSLIDNCDKNKDYEITILHTGISKPIMDEAYKLQTPKISIIFKDVHEYLNSISKKLPIRDYYSKTTYYRLFIADMYPNLKKAIYIDSDTIVVGDISELYEVELGDNLVAGCHEQAMIQVNEYGEYVEFVLGISRYNYFNAGIILINCEEFRKVGVLDKFIDLLGVYSFVVTQDEDYLNVICEDRTLFLNQGWNVEAQFDVPVEEKDYKIIHYMMVAKPWHYEDCKLKEYFWKYAKLSPFYDDILKDLNSYTDEDRKKDAESCERLLQTAIRETNRQDNYFNMMAVNQKKSPERMRILEKIEKLEREGKFDQDVEADPPSKELTPDAVDYMRTSFRRRFASKFAFMIAKRFVNKLIKNKQLIIKEIKGIEHFKNLDSGAIITCNHFNPFDSFAIQLVYLASEQKKKFYRVIKEGNYTSFPGFYGFLMRNCNTLPLSSNFETMKEFLKATSMLLNDGNFVLVYPEQSLWWNYRKPKPLKKGAFNIASRNNVPVLPCFITMEDSDIKDENGFFVQEYTIHVSPPIYPDHNKSASKNAEDMLNKNYEVWKEIYENTYKTKLTYLCDDKG